MWNHTLLRRSVLAILWVAWAAIVLDAYYVQLWGALGGLTTPSAWTIAPPDERVALPLFAAGTAAMATIAGLLVAALFWRAHGWSASVTSLSVPQRLAGCAILLGGLAIVLPLWREHIMAAAARVQVPGLPAFGEAMARAGMGVAGAALVLAAAWVTGGFAMRAIGWRGDTWRETAAYTIACGFAVISYASLALAAAGLYRPLVIGGALAALMLVAGERALNRRGAEATDQEGAGNPAEAGRPAGAATDAWAKVAVGLAVVITFWTALAPETEYDALWYHLELPRQWLLHGGPIDRIEDYVSLYPLTWELIFGAGLALGGDVSARLLHFACLPLLALIVFEATKRFGAGSPWLACALFVTAPTVMWEASTTYVDLALALHVTLALYALVRYATGGARAWLIVAAIQFGVGAATKHLGLVALAIAAGMLVVARLAALRTSGVGALLGRGALTVAVRPAVILVAIALIFPAPWYVRNWLLSGNPVFPEMFDLFGAFPPERWNAAAEAGLDRFKAHFGRPRTFVNLLRMPWDVTVHGALYGGSLGPLFLILIPGLLCAVIPALKSRATSMAASAAWWALTFAGLYVAVWASPISSFQLRFLIPIVPLLAFAAAAAYATLHDLLADIRPVRALLAAAMGLLLLLNLPPLTPFHEADRRAWDGWLTHVVHIPPVRVVTGRERTETYLARLIPSYPAWQYVNRHAPASAKILTFTGGDVFYARRPRISTDAPVARPAVWGARVGQEEQVRAALRALGVTHLLVDRRAIDQAAPGSLAIGQSPALVRDYRLEYDDGRFTLYRVGAAAAMQTAQR